MLEKKSSNYCDVAPLEQTTLTTVILGILVGWRRCIGGSGVVVWVVGWLGLV